MYNLDEIHKFPEPSKLLNLNQKESENLNKQIATNETEAVIKKLLTNKSPRLDGFTGEFYQRFQELTPIILKLSQKMQ